MNWYNGNIAEAVAQSKAKNAIFVVYVEGKDENSTKLSKFIDHPEVKGILETDDFVAIKIESDSQAYMQFASIYQMVPVPSIFFIGNTGTPLEIATGVVASVEELNKKISKVLQLAGRKPSGSAASVSSQAFIDQESKTEPNTAPKQTAEENLLETKDQQSDQLVCEDGVCYKKPKDTNEVVAKISAADDLPAQKNQTETNDQSNKNEEKLEDTRKKLEQKRRERVEEEKRLEKERELRRREEGKKTSNLQAWQKDQELQDLKDSIKREKLEEQAARDRILAQIAADKAERAQKFATENQPSTSKAAPATHSPAATDETRLQFRFASGINKANNFKCSVTLEEVRTYVQNELIPGSGIKEFTLATTYPKREFGSVHYTQTLSELELYPSAVILIIGKEATGPSAMIARQGGLFNIISMVVMSILNPIFGLLTTAKNWVTGQRDNTRADDKGANTTQTGAQKRANEERGVQDDVAKRRNLERFLTGNTNNDNDSANKGNSSAGGTSQAYRRYVTGSNVHRLTDNRKDSDDENATWNGNSTQQQ